MTICFTYLSPTSIMSDFFLFFPGFLRLTPVPEESPQVPTPEGGRWLRTADQVFGKASYVLLTFASCKLNRVL